MSITQCWDCPIPLWTAVGGWLLLASAAAFGLWLLGRGAQLVRAAGAVLLIVATLIQLAYAVFVPGWGVLRPGEAWSPFEPLLVRIAYWTAFAFYCICLLAAIRRRESPE